MGLWDIVRFVRQVYRSIVSAQHVERSAVIIKQDYILENRCAFCARYIHYNDVTISVTASQFTDLSIVFSAV